MSVEEPSSSTPTFSSVNPPLSREDVAIGSVTQHVMGRAVSMSLTPSEPVMADPNPEDGSVSQPSTDHIDVSVFHRTDIPENAAPIPVQPYAQPVPVPADQPQPVQRTSEPITPETPKSTRLRVLLPALSGVAFLVFCGAFAGFIHWHSRRNNPNTVFNDALQASLMTTQVEQRSSTGAYYNVADFDFTNMNNPIVSTQTTLNQNGSQFQLAGYGTAKNTYISYMKFPSNISSSITSMVTNGWVQIRSNGILPKDASLALDNVADPRYQDIGLLSFGNFNQTTRDQLVNYINSEHIYNFQANKVTHTTLNGEPVFAFPVSVNVDYLKIYEESIATDQGFSPNDVSSAINNIGNWSNAKATFYVSANTHRFVAIDMQQAGKNTRFSFSDYDTASLPQEPVTNLEWSNFAPVQQLIEQEAAVHQSSSKFGMNAPALTVPIS